MIDDGFISDSKAIMERRAKSSNMNTVVLWMHAEWCGPCRRIEPKVNELVTNTADKIEWFDIMVPKDDFEKYELKETWGFETIPCFFVWKKESKDAEPVFTGPIKWDELNDTVV